MKIKEMIENFINNIKKEKDRIRWPNKTKMLNGYVNVLSVILLFVVFFLIVDLITGGVISLFK